jgi:cyclopropane fatty-acyl-phospholipid synthase-like methyltransferase
MSSFLKATMSEPRPTLKPDHFEAIYAADPDPWNFAASPYERAKYTLTLDAIPKTRSHSAIEVGCSIGVMTRLLAERCDSLLAVDAAQAPLVEAKRRCANLPNMRFKQMFVPEQWPDGVFDLILLSEIVYYLSREDVSRLTASVLGSLAPDGSVILVHWTGSTNYPLSGDEAVALFIEQSGPGVVVTRADRHAEFRLDVLSRA